MRSKQSGLLLCALLDSLEKRCLFAVPALTGATYNVFGDGGGTWNGSVLTFTSQVATSTGANVEGHFDWYSGTGTPRGRELFKGTVSNSLQLSVAGYQLVNPVGIAVANYKATVSSNGVSITSGTWSGPGVIPGVWSAVRVTTAPEIEVRGKNVVIADNDASPSTADDTDFGTTAVATTVLRTFTVKNTGSKALTTSTLKVPTGFTVTEGLSASIAAGGSDTFTVRLNATAAGTYSGKVSFTNNDSSESAFDFAIKGVVNVPTFNLAGGVLTVTGTSGADYIRGSIASNVLTMKVNGLSKTFSNASSISKVVINALAGNDLILLAGTVNRPTSLNGGDGNDTISGGSGTDVINGGNGTDSAFKGTGDSVSLVEEILS